MAEKRTEVARSEEKSLARRDVFRSPFQMLERFADDRSVALPEGAMTDQAKATFKDGVLEITVPAPPESVKRGRRLEIAEPATQKK